MDHKFWDSWRLKVEGGKSIWHFIPPTDLNQTSWIGELNTAQKDFLERMSEAFMYDKAKNPNSGDKVYRAQCEAKVKNAGKAPISAKEAASKGINYYQSLQADDGCWPGDYGGPMFLLPGLIIAAYITETPFPPAHQALMKRYMLNHQNADGGWGLHLEGRSTMFGTVLQYVALRILGQDTKDPQVARAKEWIHQHGGATMIPSWGKFYLSLLGVYEWEGCNSLFPEMWLLPQSLPFHPSRYWCHSRMVYLPMAYCYGHKVKMKESALNAELRKELYTQEYAAIDWKEARDRCAPSDLYYPQSKVMGVLNAFTNGYEKIYAKGLRQKALDFILEYIDAEDQQTNYINIGPVNQVINAVCVWHAYGKSSEQFQKHSDRWFDYLWLAEDGMKMQGYNGSQLWDTAFAVQAVTESGLEKEYPDVIHKAYNYIDRSQIVTEVADRGKFFRHIQIGGWPFSTIDHGWPISDCTAEGLKATLAIHHTGIEAAIDDSRLYQAVNVILSYQNKDGGWATYENTRAPQWIEALNPSEVFGNIMTDYSYTECSSACVQSLLKFQADYPDQRADEIRQAITKGIEYIISQQEANGGWYGSWAVCYTYGTWFGMEALSQFILAKGFSASLKDKASKAIDKACAFLLSRQNTDGGWGESFESCIEKRYVPSATSQVVNTSWALMSLMAAGHADDGAIKKGIDLIQSRQQTSGDWLQENISGVFNHNCMITYTSYRSVFPIWALGRYAKKYELT